MSFETCGWCGRTYQYNSHRYNFKTPKGNTLDICSPKCRKEAIREFGVETEEDRARRHEEWIKNAPHRRSKYLDDFVLWEGSFIYKMKYGNKKDRDISLFCFFGGFIFFGLSFADLSLIVAGLCFWGAAWMLGHGSSAKSREEVEEYLNRINKKEGFDEAGVPITYDDF